MLSLSETVENAEEKTVVRGAAGRRGLKAWVGALEMTAPIGRDPLRSFPVLIDELAERFGPAAALLSDEECLSYQALAQRASRYARWALEQGLRAGDVVCLLMPNSPDYLAIWVGLTRVGCVVALVNTNLAGASLAHSINIVAPKHVIVGASLAGTVAAVLPRLAPGIQCWSHGHGDQGFPRIDRQIERLAGDRLDSSACPLPCLTDRALYIYTSGTTGLPKAANVSHARLMQWSHWFAGMMGTGPSDRMYNCLPMYHSIGGVAAVGAVLVGGGSVVIRERFSASRFWDDIVRWDCTLFQYIGELCRYLAAGPPSAHETAHRIRLCCGNGLRPDVWDAFRRRFGIPQILEFYAATEGSFSLYNCEGEPGAIGRIPPFLAHRFPVALVRLDAETGTPLRGGDGLCIRCTTDEAGEAIGKLAVDGADAGGRFEGYADDAASAKKVMRDVFLPGDAWFRTGDLMRKDGRGYFYFVDRVGDSFRWKGENVSTLEVAEVIAACPGVIEATAYGVAVPGTEGRAGMAALVASPGLDLAVLRRHLAEHLPEYARPLFLRLSGGIEATTTFKPKKQDLAREGYDPAVTADAIYFDDRLRQAFVPLDAALHERIQASGLRL